jgi:5-(carboxyamino)imidazole ribonucleotide synthase
MVINKQVPESLDAFIASADVFTYEFENIPVAWVERIAAQKPVYPSVKSLAISQNRLNEKNFFTNSIFLLLLTTK